MGRPVLFVSSDVDENLACVLDRHISKSTRTVNFRVRVFGVRSCSIRRKVMAALDERDLEDAVSSLRKSAVVNADPQYVLWDATSVCQTITAVRSLRRRQLTADRDTIMYGERIIVEFRSYLRAKKKWLSDDDANVLLSEFVPTVFRPLSAPSSKCVIL